MSKRIEKKRIRKLIENTIKTVQMKVPTGIQRTGVNMSYDYIEDRVYVDCERVTKAHSEMKAPVLLEEYIKTLTIHELGHAIDRDSLLSSMNRMIEIAKLKRKHAFIERREKLELFSVDIEAHEMDIEFEKTAWNNARLLNKKYHVVSEEVFDQIEAHSMSSYMNFYEKDLITYKRLVAAERMKERPIETIEITGQIPV
ncbi:integrase [Aciduricibacillus chroicocephali]|uniref:Integrase n=1 Tax=Aciduricibacillus chroicocephali TaxID=3054939 RepID=A0ABY9KVT7_9BACI|nr:integrase [Bacillaceae bacterium 44XB]